MITLEGEWEATIYDASGGVKDYWKGHNVICTNGKEFLASFLNSAAAAASTFTCKYLAIGSDNTAEAAGNTAMGSELSRTTGTVSYVSNQMYRVSATFAAGSGTGNVYEYGLFSSSTAGVMLSRVTQGLITKGASDTLAVTCNITLS